MGKVHKVKAYYTEDTGVKPNAVLTRHFIHSKDSGGLWADIRDLSQKEMTTAGVTEKPFSLYITIGYNPKVLQRWETLVIIDEQGRTYKVKTKPDEFNYGKGDIRIAAYAFTDNSVYTGADTYDN